MKSAWDRPDWYDQHDSAAETGKVRVPEHYRELVIALPPLDRETMGSMWVPGPEELGSGGERWRAISVFAFGPTRR